ncbi:MAG: hypothetical protein M3Q81_00085 [bacterium]|nr:hypothetical protein [bacterium]
MKKYLKILITAVGCLLLMLVAGKLSPSFAATRTWDGGGSTESWDDCSNWSSDICPTSVDTATFNSTSTKNSTVAAGSNFTGTITNLFINSGYTGVITQTSPFVVTAFSHGAAATYTASNQNLTINGSFSLSNANAVFTASSLTTRVATSFSITDGTFNHNSGAVEFNANDATLSCGNVTFNRVNFTHGSSSTKTVNSNCNLPLDASPTIAGRITLSGTLSGTGTLNISVLNYSSGANLSGFSGLISGSTLTISATTGNTSLNLSNYTTVDLNGLVLSTPTGAFTNTFTAPTGVMTNSGALTINTGTTFNANGGTLTFDGFSGILSCNNTVFSTVTFAITPGGSSNVSSNCTMPLGSSPTVVGTITLHGTLTGTGTLSIGGLSFYQTGVLSGFNGLVVTSGNTFVYATAGNTHLDLSSFTTVDLNGSLNLPTPTGSFTNTFTAPSGTMILRGGFTKSAGATFNANNGSITFLGTSKSLSCNNATFNNVTVSLTSDANSVAQTGICNVNNLTLSVGAWSNPAAAAVLNISGNFNKTAPTSFGGANLTLNLVGSGTQDITNSVGSFSSIFNVSNSGTARLLSSFTVSSRLCTVVSGVFSLNGNNFTCATGFTVNNGTTLQLRGSETVTTPTLNSGSTIKYVGDGDSASDIFSLANWTYSNLVIVATDGNSDTFNLNHNFSPATLILTAGTVGTTGATTLSSPGSITISGATWNPGSLAIAASGGINCSSGTFSAGSATIDINGTFNLSGCNMTAPASWMTISGDFTHLSGTFTPNGGTVTLDGSNQQLTG